MSIMVNEAHKDFTGNVEFHALLSEKRKLKLEMDALKNRLETVDLSVKETIGAYTSFTCGQFTGTYREVSKKSFTVSAKVSRILLLDK